MGALFGHLKFSVVRGRVGVSMTKFEDFQTGPMCAPDMSLESS